MSVIKKLGWFFKLEWKRYLIGVISLILVSVLNLIPPMMMGNVIDHIATGDLTTSQLVQNVAMLVVAAFSMYALRFIWRQFIIGTSNKLGRLLRSRLFKQFTKMSPSFFQKHRTGDLMAHATNDVRVVNMLAGPGVMSAVDASVTALVTLMTMFFGLSWQLTLLAILPLPIMTVLTTFVSRRSYKSVLESQEMFSQLNNKVQENISGIKVIKSFGYQHSEMADFEKVNDAAYMTNMKMTRYQALYDPVTGVCIAASYAITLWFGGYLISQNQLTLGNMITFVTYLDMLVWPLKAWSFLVNMIQRGNVAYERIENLLSQESDVFNEADTHMTFDHADLVYAIDSFQYDHSETLRDIHFTLFSGQTLGIVGPTGSGKTTLIKLLLREFDVTNGSITFGGSDIKMMSLNALRSHIGYVPQDQMLFATSILENIRFANPEYSIEDVKQAARLSCVANDIESMNDQYNTIIGERGVSLSGGQKQRIAIARALIMNPPVLILDDSLSAVDAKTEHIIVDNLKSSRKDKTTIITAHRLSAVNHADLILVVDNGQIVERGTHDELIAQGGWYATTYQSQQLESEEVVS
ncbi:ABC transporter ATP-binding protein [Carnobacteriaceae bacterium zg-ZUI252]|nr:ABC transporter ATP-binding protein [Carnobacteriaceae bacterium zg-ZUI252]